MEIDIQTYRDEHVPVVALFNKRLRAAGLFEQLPDSPPQRTRMKVECRLAIANNGGVIGGYVCLTHSARIGHKDGTVAAVPLVLISPEESGLEQSSIVRSLIDDACRRNPYSYFNISQSAARHTGEPDEVGLRVLPVHSYFRVCNPGMFLKNLGALREKTAWRVLSDVASATGVGKIGILSLQASRRKKRTRLGRLEAEPVSGFDARINELWEEAGASYSLAVARSKGLMTERFAEKDHTTRRLLVNLDGSLVGWAVVYDRQMKRDARYGDMRVGIIEECFGSPDYSDAVIEATTEFTEQLGVDLIVTHQTHPWWCSALANAGYLAGTHQSSAFMTERLAETIDKSPDGFDRIHMVPSDLEAD